MASVEASLKQSSDDTDELEHAINRLGHEWDDVADAYRRAGENYADAKANFDRVSDLAGKASQEYRAAQEEFETAARRWRLYSQLIVIAASMDIAYWESVGGVRNLSRSQAARRRMANIDCSKSMSRRSYRRNLERAGQDLTFQDADHIFPASLGGVDHPANFCMIDSSLNRSLGNTWNIDKCLLCGEEKCLNAIAATLKCGSPSQSGLAAISRF